MMIRRAHVSGPEDRAIRKEYDLQADVLAPMIATTPVTKKHAGRTADGIHDAHRQARSVLRHDVRDIRCVAVARDRPRGPRDCRRLPRVDRCAAAVHMSIRRYQIVTACGLALSTALQQSGLAGLASADARDEVSERWLTRGRSSASMSR
ncbi:hypothetical protein [Paraburkholderia oxyphila]|uniref:hypothetical protein n=1 Tax=Paraburkholderia oxyphila TaxID=614212 RepID=UPI000482289D|nr:hypothetical protein [Paraburkholderia oxyphila]